MFRCCFVLLLSAALCFTSPFAHAVPADQIFPDSTKGFVSIRNLKDFGDQWQQTQFGQLMDDPLMAEFKKEVQTQLAERLEKTFGLTLAGISSLPSGEVAFGMIAIPNQVPGYVLTMDVSGKRAETNDYLAKLTQKLVAAGAKRSTVTYRGQQITALIFPPPAIPRTETPRTLGNTRIEIKAEPIERRAFYMLRQDVLIASDQLPLLQLIADRLTAQGGGSLAQVEAYQVTMRRCLSDVPSGTQPIIRWYIEPLDYGESARSLLRGPVVQRQRDKPSVFSTLKQQGFDAIQGIGGVVSVKTEEQETVYRTFAYTKKPYRLAMQMLNLPASTNFAPPTWIPSDVARCTMLFVDPQTIFDNFGGLFDGLAMGGVLGVWEDILEGLELDPHGPRINLREELIAHLSNRVLSLSWYEKPITATSEHFVVAVELKPGREPAMQASAKKLFATDSEVQEIQHRSYTIWQRLPAPDDEEMPFFPEGAIVIAKGNLFVSTDVASLKTVLDRLDAPGLSSTIGNEADYKQVNQIFAGMGLANLPHSFQFFARTHETVRPTYEMVRKGQLAQSQALLGKLLHTVFLPDAEWGQRFDGVMMPEFEKVQHYFGGVGIYGIPEENGFFIKGFTIERTR